ncbi:MAG: RNA polymerase sigma-70 factor [Bacteroidales bacterium]|nr:RNA polymerase sigma-70 factor [Bacteroidales bacterium]
MLSDEEKLLKRISEGDQTAFRMFFGYYYPKAKTFMLSLIDSEEDVNDLVQNLFVKLWMIRSSLGKLRSAGAYIYKMCRNAAIDYGRTHKVRIPFTDSTESPETYALDEEYFAKERQLQIDKAVDRMPYKRREVFLLSRKEGMSNEQIAKDLGISKKTVENHINAVLKELRKISSCIAVFL